MGWRGFSRRETPGFPRKAVLLREPRDGVGGESLPLFVNVGTAILGREA